MMDSISPDQAMLPANAQLAQLDAAVAEGDFIVLALPLTNSTQHIVDAKFLARIKPGALLINPARGSLVDEAAVADALSAGLRGG